MSKIKLVGKNDFTTIPNGILRDTKLSLKAKGLFAYMWSLPNDWDYSVAGLVMLLKEGRDSINGALKELEHEGYLTREYKRTSGKFSDIDYLLTAYPDKKESSPITENPVSEKPQQLNTNKTKEKRKTKSLPTEEREEASSSPIPLSELSAKRSGKKKSYKDILSDPQYSLVQDSLRSFIKYLKGMNVTPSVDQLEKWAKFLVSEAKGDPAISYAIVDQSMSHLWKGLFKLRKNSIPVNRRIVTIPGDIERDGARDEAGELIVF